MNCRRKLIMENNLVKEEWINGKIMMSKRPQYNHMEIQYAIDVKLRKYFNNSCKVGIEISLFLTNENPIQIRRDVVKIKK
ncbi:MAG: hypothetical protein ACREV6_20505 [Clostridium sp.]|uniref:hypothetical protein n=1 Tax=Clostridium sp. TaxID=1506 RepID=UPI003D6CEB28